MPEACSRREPSVMAWDIVGMVSSFWFLVSGLHSNRELETRN